MPAPIYAKSRNEKAWGVVEPVANVLTEVVAADAFPLLPGAAIPSALKEFTESLQRSGSAGVSALIERKKRPGEWSIPVYGAFGAAAGTPPKYGTFLKQGFGQETIAGGTSVTYALVTDVSEKLVSIHHFIDNMIFSHRGSIVNRIALALSGSEEARITLSGLLLNTTLAGVSLLSGGIDNIVTTINVSVEHARRYVVGPDANDVQFLNIDAETVKLTAVNYGTGALTVVRGQKGTTAASHSNGAEITPWTPGVDPDPADIIAPVTLGEITLGALALIRGISFTQEINNNMEARLDEYGLGVSTGYRPAGDGKRRVTGEFRGYLLQGNQALLSDPERAFEVVGTIRAGNTLTARLTVNIPRFRFRVISIDTSGVEPVIVGQYQALENAGNDETNWVMD